MTTDDTRLRASPIDGRWNDAGVAVWWRLGTADGDEPPTRVARRWVEEIVTRDGRIAWPGFADVPARAKPRLAGHDRADFSISHSGRTVLVAVSSAGKVGADVEVAPYAAFGSAALRRRMLSASEHRVLAELAPEHRTGYLARLWTAKEAMTKATGAGLTRDFRRFGVPVLRTARSQPLEACIAVISASGTHLVRLAVPTSPPRPKQEA